MSPSYELIDFLKWWEGEPGGVPALDCYLDSGGTPTIGYGKTGPDVVMGMTCTVQEAENWLTSEVDEVGGGVRNLVAVPSLPQEKYDALVSFAYNLGLGALAGSSLMQYVNNFAYDKAALEFLKWDHVREKGKLVVSAGLLKRRHAEMMIFSNRDYSGRP